MRRRLILGLLAAALVGPARASTAKKEGEAESDGAGLYVDLAPAALPVIMDGRLVNYVFVQVRVLLAPGSNTVSLRTREPFFRDALVRAAHRTPFVTPGQIGKLDEAAIRRVMLAETRRIAGARSITGIQVVNQAPLRRRPFPVK